MEPIAVAARVIATPTLTARIITQTTTEAPTTIREMVVVRTPLLVDTKLESNLIGCNLYKLH